MEAYRLDETISVISASLDERQLDLVGVHAYRG